MKIDLSTVNLSGSTSETNDDIVRFALFENLLLLNNNPFPIPFFSVDPEIEAKKLSRIIKAHERVLDWYTVRTTDE